MPRKKQATKATTTKLHKTKAPRKVGVSGLSQQEASGAFDYTPPAIFDAGKEENEIYNEISFNL